MALKLLIFDFDGVIADTETLACAVAAAYATDLGAPMSAEDGLRFFMGKRVADVADAIAHRGATIPKDFVDQLQSRTLDAFATDLVPVPGVEDFLCAQNHLLRCIASSSSHTRIAASLDRLNLWNWFRGRVFSVDDVSRGKPFPDIFLHAARIMETKPENAIIIEDSVTGVAAGVAAGIRVIGLLAGSHTSPDQGERLLAAGATIVAPTYEAITAWIAQNEIVPRDFPA